MQEHYLIKIMWVFFSTAQGERQNIKNKQKKLIWSMQVAERSSIFKFFWKAEVIFNSLTWN